MQNKKKIISLCLAFVLLFAAVGGTIAYLTDHDQAENVFTVGKIDINLFEQVGVTDALGNDLTAEKVIETENGSQFINLLPGNVVTKAPTIHNNGGNDAYVRVVVTMNNYTKINDAIDKVYEDKDYTTEQIQAVYDNVFNGWGIDYTKNPIRGSMARRASEIGETLLGIDYVRGVSGQYQSGSKGTWYMEDFYYGSDSGRYYENAYLNDGRIYVFYLKLESQDTYTLFNGLNVPAEWDADQLAMFDGLEINIYADAIQTEGFENAKDAFAALEAQHPLGWWN